MSIVINTPNGNIGRPLVEKLLKEGRKVTVISRTAEKVADLVKQGAKWVQGSIDEQATLDAALAGAEELFWLTPPAMRPDFQDWATATGRLAAERVKAHGVKRVVLISSIGAQTGPGTGPVSVLKSIEEAFQAAAPNVVSLRAGFFMENLLRDVQGLAKAGALFSPNAETKRLPMVATADIAAKAAGFLLDTSWTGHRYVGVHGPRDLTYPEVASILTQVLGQPVKYVRVGLEDVRKGMLGAGMPSWAADTFVEMYGAVLDGRMDPAEPRSKETTTPTTLEHFASTVLKPAVERARAS
ncbi:NmrA family transcriptional regulator [Corallococcus sp. AB049A]|uniref:NmrA family transcriptional regulator n=1 Tax=Corallococcus interemptor TaxID=2316720 RepID=A0A3A8QJV3_9BACT|nr:MULTISPECIES: NmrA family NAD(P)-binding protein [Corallococcus]RKH44774.1 NmrA family transcriptional regulator [Corallococcus sp. AB050B]RKH66615.1 NmrA family transcriptional regulator [Corallococcus interemptor]RKI42878.1 NmrA family transcriptional regulator [Corallococcus sp. AB049A]